MLRGQVKIKKKTSKTNSSGQGLRAEPPLAHRPLPAGSLLHACRPQVPLRVQESALCAVQGRKPVRSGQKIHCGRQRQTPTLNTRPSAVSLQAPGSGTQPLNQSSFTARVVLDGPKAGLPAPPQLQTGGTSLGRREPREKASWALPPPRAPHGSGPPPSLMAPPRGPAHTWAALPALSSGPFSHSPQGQAPHPDLLREGGPACLTAACLTPPATHPMAHCVSGLFILFVP